MAGRAMVRMFIIENSELIILLYPFPPFFVTVVGTGRPSDTPRRAGKVYSQKGKIPRRRRGLALSLLAAPADEPEQAAV